MRAAECCRCSTTPFLPEMGIDFSRLLRESCLGDGGNFKFYTFRKLTTGNLTKLRLRHVLCIDKSNSINW